MPWQGHIWVGEQPTSLQHLRDIMGRLNVDTPDIDWSDNQLEYDIINEYVGVYRERNWPTIQIPTNIGTVEDAIVKFYFEYESGIAHFLSKIFHSQQSGDFWCIVGTRLTGRYGPNYIDIDPQRRTGTPQPFPLDLKLLADIVEAVKNQLNWPNAQIYMFENFHFFSPHESG